MGNADQDISAAIQGVEEDVNGNPTQTPVGATPVGTLPGPGGYRKVYVRARTTLSNTLALVPFSWPFNGTSPATTSALDQMQGASEQTSWRYVDTDGILWDLKAWQLVQIEHFKDGLPPLTPELIAKYRTTADTIRNWPTTDVITGASYEGAFPGEPTQVYPAYPPAAAPSA
jgi:hypothetical protein